MAEAFISLAFAQHDFHSDVIVVGAGVAGICAAVAAARSGASVVLVTDRPVLGGNCSGEIGVGMNGAAYSPYNLWARETGIAEEIRNRHAACWSGTTESYWTTMDRVYLDLVLGESTLRLLLNTSIFAAQCGPDREIQSIQGVQLRAENVFTIHGRFFIDCSGDGTLGALAGADSRQGREARSEYGESMAPEVADARTMGTTLLWRSRDAGHPVKFRVPAWAIDVSKLPPFARPGCDLTRDMSREGMGGFHGLWWAEFGGQIDTLHDDQKVLLHTRALVYGIWDWVKNSGRMSHVPNLTNQELVHVAVLGGKRESRRLLGPVVLAENHWRRQEQFDDAIAYTGWPIDVHPPRGYLDDEPGCSHIWLPGPSDIPLRALYSRNVPNLFFAGRCFSVTHIGLGSPRVIATTAVCGQAAGAAAAMCVQDGAVPAALSPSQVSRLQQRLLRMDQGILGKSLDEPNDLARRATISVSSTCAFEQVQGDAVLALAPDTMPDLPCAIDQTHSHWHSGSAGAMVAIPAAGKVDYVELLLAGEAGREVEYQIFLADRPDNYRLHAFVGSQTGTIGPDGWTRFQLGQAPNEGQKFLLYFPAQPQLALRVWSQIMPGVAAVRMWAKPDEPLIDHELSRKVCTPCFRISPAQDLFAAANVADGHIRPHGLPHLWRSAPMQPGQPETLTLSWPAPVTIRQVELVFDSQLNGEPRGIAPTLMKQYELLAYPEGKATAMAQVAENSLRYVVHACQPTTTARLELKIHSTHSSPHAALYAIRVYS